jgi:hypothetical protein
MPRSHQAFILGVTIKIYRTIADFQPKSTLARYHIKAVWADWMKRYQREKRNDPGNDLGELVK